MHEELLIGLRGHAKRMGCDDRCPCYDAENRGYSTCSEELAEKAADVIEEMDAAMPRWIPVTEKLPEDRRDVLVYAGVMFPYITVGYYDGLWKFSYNDEEINGSADYWMPLPQPPKEET